ncbi:MAG: DUF4921 family protein [Firmicutes bacterium]|nr:DUF4921 family protein [Bacillota bacterium]
MPELRKDILTGTWVIIATERGKRPHDFARPAETKKGGTCPFCYGNEGLTPPEVLAYRDGSPPDTPGWSIRVVPNKFPALSPDLAREEPRYVGPHLVMNAAGGHEVLVESPRHDSSLGTHDVDQVELVIRALKDRIRAYGRGGRVEYVQAFKNSGATAGASLEHTHFQLIALPVTPGVVQAEMRGLNRGNGGDCTLCDVLRYESENGDRIVDESAGFIVYCPVASRFPYETWIAPACHLPRFEETPEDLSRELAAVLRNTVRRLEAAFDNPPYNLILHTAPFGAAGDGFHWHIEILPRLTIAAGFELGTGYYINPTPPEMAAPLLREVSLGLEGLVPVSGEAGPAGSAQVKGDEPRDTRP